MTEAGVGYKVELDVFEGPLDLLLHLVRKHELDILDIPISFVTQKYLEYLDLMKGLNVDVASEYLVMAATLALIKSRELLPPDPTAVDEEGEPEEEIDPRAELIRRLLEYQKYKEAAGQLGERPVVGRNVWTRGVPQEEALAENVDSDVMAPLADMPVIKLIEALARALDRVKVKIEHTVNVDRLSVSERINHLVDRLETEKSFSFMSCFTFLTKEGVISSAEIRHEAVVTFLAMLELAKLGIIRVSQPDADHAAADEQPDIYISSAIDNLRERVAETVATGDEYR